MSDDNANQEILNKYNEIKQKYTLLDSHNEWFVRYLNPVFELKWRKSTCLAATQRTLSSEIRKFCLLQEWPSLGGIKLKKLL